MEDEKNEIQYSQIALTTFSLSFDLTVIILTDRDEPIMYALDLSLLHHLTDSEVKLWKSRPWASRRFNTNLRSWLFLTWICNAYTMHSITTKYRNLIKTKYFGWPGLIFSKVIFKYANKSSWNPMYFFTKIHRKCRTKFPWDVITFSWVSSKNCRPKCRK